MRKRFKRHTMDSFLLGLVVFLTLFGLIMVFESSFVYSFSLFGNRYKFFLQQLFWVLFGFAGMYYVYRLGLKDLRNISFVLFVVAIGFLLVVLIPSGFSQKIYGARRWLMLNPKPFPEIPLIGRVSFQPSDFAKFAFVLYLSSLLTSKRKHNAVEVLVSLCVVLIVVLGLVVLEPDFGTALVFLGVALAIYFVSGAPIKYFLVGGPVLGILGAFFVFSSSYRRQRFLTFLNPSSANPLTTGYHIKQVLIAIGSGGLFGLGFGQSRQKYAYLPEVVSDSIFAVISEEFGFIGALVLVTLFMVLIWKGIQIAKKSTSPFGRLVAVGVTTWIGLQVFMNLFAMVNLIPLTGIPLPFISYGGSSMIFNLLGIGLLLNVSKSSAKS